MSWDFAEQLRQFGPAAQHSAAHLATVAEAYCTKLAREHYENFTVATLFVPRHLRSHVAAVYAWCRWADDLADETPAADAPALLTWWREELGAMFAGQPTHIVTTALQHTVRRFRIPSDPFEQLLSAFRQDQTVRDYNTFEQLVDYCRRSANPVGHLVLYLYECYSADRVTLADATCTGLQLANFWQDVARDLAKGRLYLPREDREQFGVSHADLAAPTASESVRELIRFQVNRTHPFFERGEALVPQLPRAARRPVALFGTGGQATLHAIKRQNYDVLIRRPKVSRWAKTKLALRTLI